MVQREKMMIQWDFVVVEWDIMGLKEVKMEM
jgi:hypothetical protein